MGVCNCSMFCCKLLYVYSSIAIILIGKRELVALLNLSSWCLVMVEQLFLAMPRGCLRFVIVAFPDHTHFLFFTAFQHNNMANWQDILSYDIIRLHKGKVAKSFNTKTWQTDRIT